MNTLQRGGWAVGAAALALASQVHAQAQAQAQAQTSAPPAIPSSSVTLYGVVDMAVEAARTGNGGLQGLGRGGHRGARLRPPGTGGPGRRPRAGRWVGGRRTRRQ